MLLGRFIFDDGITIENGWVLRKVIQIGSRKHRWTGSVRNLMTSPLVSCGVSRMSTLVEASLSTTAWILHAWSVLRHSWICPATPKQQ